MQANSFYFWYIPCRQRAGATMPKSDSRLDDRFFAYLRSEKRQTVTPGQVGRALGLAPRRAHKLLHRLARARLISRVRPGLYLVPSSRPASGWWFPSEAKVLAALMADRAGRYQLCGINAFNHYHWDEQVPNSYCLYNNRFSGDRQIGHIHLMLFKVADSRLGGLDPLVTPDGVRLNYPTKARALMDAVYDWARFGSLPRAYGWIRKELASDDAMAAQLVDVSTRYGNQATLRRIGKLLDLAGAAEPLLRKLEQRLNPSCSRIPFIPRAPVRGPADKRWGVIDNELQTG